jgi:hypothetical protein
LLISGRERKVENIWMVDEDNLSHRLQDLLNEIAVKEFRKVFGAWINRLLDVSQGDGGYIS